MSDVLTRPFLAELAENDGLEVTVLNGRVWARSRCPHVLEDRREIRSPRDIDAVLWRASYCLVRDCPARLDAGRVLAELARVGSGR